MNNQEFNPVYDNEAASRLEFSPAEDEKPRREEGAQKKEFFADDRDAEKEFSGGLSENAESDDNKKDTASRRKRLKMLLALTGTTVVVAGSGVFRSNTPPANAGHTDECVFTTEYNDLFEEILKLREKGQYKDILTLIETSEEMQDCVATLYPHQAERIAEFYGSSTTVQDRVRLIYDGNTVSNCKAEISNPASPGSSPYILLLVYVGVDGQLGNGICIFFSNSLDYSENYFRENDTIDLTMVTDNAFAGEAFPYRLLTFTFTDYNKGQNFYGFCEKWQLSPDGDWLRNDQTYTITMYADEWDQNPSGDVQEHIVSFDNTEITNPDTTQEDINEQMQYLIDHYSENIIKYIHE